MSYFSRAATSRGPEIPVLIKSCVFYYAAQLIHADYCSFTSPGLSPHSKICHVSVRQSPWGLQHSQARAGFNQSNVGNKWKRTEGQEGDPGWKQRERGDLGGKWVKRKQKKKEGRQISGKETPGAFLGISIF